ncbi:nuclear transport factor 2 family protein [Glycomyces albidus]|uniref:DUF4878 domain-containing protein n=1 Tax=Glycomyces albidus TaxID=2656774 RepID=A0A6L5G5D1_9ACTN|nr:hypothetical protein [Glycomyces albidus]MQM24856.1 hypothetical protein [Glycomyces albidus]
MHPFGRLAPTGLAAAAALTTALALTSCTDIEGTPEDAVRDYYADGHPAIAGTLLLGGEADAISDAAAAHFCEEYVGTFNEFAERADGEVSALASNLTDLTEADIVYEVAIVETTQDGETATVEAEVFGPTLPDGTVTTETRTLDLAVEDGEWKICGPID